MDFDKTLTLCMSVSSDWCMQLAVMLKSVEIHLNPALKLNAFVFHFGIPAELQRRVESSLESGRLKVHWRMVDLRFFREFQPRNPSFPRESYVRLALETLLPECQRTIWLDADLVVIRDLGELWSQDLKEHPLAAAPCVTPRFITYGKAVGCSTEHAELAPESPAFNAGVLVIDLQKWRKIGVWSLAQQEVLRHSNRHFCGDQDVLNTILHSRWQRMDPKWNVQSGVLKYPFFVITRFSFRAWASWVFSPSLIHFNSRGARPWNRDCDSFFRFLYYRYLDETSWRGYRPQGWRVPQPAERMLRTRTVLFCRVMFHLAGESMRKMLSSVSKVNSASGTSE